MAYPLSPTQLLSFLRFVLVVLNCSNFAPTTTAHLSFSRTLSLLWIRSMALALFSAGFALRVQFPLPQLQRWIFKRIRILKLWVRC